MTGWTCMGLTELSERATSRLVFLLTYRLRFETSSECGYEAFHTWVKRQKMSEVCKFDSKHFVNLMISTPQNRLHTVRADGIINTGQTQRLLLLFLGKTLNGKRPNDAA